MDALRAAIASEQKIIHEMHSRTLQKGVTAGLIFGIAMTALFCLSDWLTERSVGTRACVPGGLSGVGFGLLMTQKRLQEITPVELRARVREAAFAARKERAVGEGEIDRLANRAIDGVSLSSLISELDKAVSSLEVKRSWKRHLPSKSEVVVAALLAAGMGGFFVWKEGVPALALALPLVAAGTGVLAGSSLVSLVADLLLSSPLEFGKEMECTPAITDTARTIAKYSPIEIQLAMGDFYVTGPTLRPLDDLTKAHVEAAIQWAEGL